MGRISDFFDEWKARRAGAKFVSRDIQKSARHIIGPTGSGYSSAWDKLAEGGEAYVESFERRIPPSLFISHRDKTRLNHPIPVVERRLEAHDDDGADDLTPEELEWARGRPERD